MRVGRRNAVGEPARAAIHVDPEELPEPTGPRLGVVIPIAPPSPIAGGDVEQAVSPERQHPAIMVPMPPVGDTQEAAERARSARSRFLALARISAMMRSPLARSVKKT